ncbi:MAG: hypothetical protein C3F02_01560 [Parcubacteria group bacterium]|nr:MAG: hypothetical protein C3F02_01560 [Parcubacteria group bacterium]
MNMKQAIGSFAQQLSYRPRVKNGSLRKMKNFVVCGMGGSHLAADIIKDYYPGLNLVIHRDYGLPAVANPKKYLTIISSYSGNTAEAITAFRQARRKKIPLACATTGGKLLALAIEHHVPYIKIPDTGIEPRSALGFSLVAMLQLMQQDKILSEIRMAALMINQGRAEKAGRALARKLKGFIPVIYTSEQHVGLGYNWKIRFNETGKIPAFYNVLPELNHNEMVGFDREKSTKKLSERFYFIFLTDRDDYPPVTIRMKVLQTLYAQKKLPVLLWPLLGKNRWHKIFQALAIADWAAYYTAKQYRLEAQETVIIDRFKKIIARRAAAYEK